MLLAPGSGTAGKLSAQMPVRLTMIGQCQSVSVTPMDFGAQRYQDWPSEVHAEARVTVACSQGAQYSIDIDNGRDPGEGRARHLRGDFIRRYDLYRDPARTQPWGSGQAGGASLSQVMGNEGVARHTVYGRVRISAGGQLGEATDTVTITLSY
jgi:spore coat protein U-like protein